MANHNQKLHKELSLEDQKKLYFRELIDTIFNLEQQGVELDKQKVAQLKNKLAAKYDIVKPPKDVDVFIFCDVKDLHKLQHLRSKPTRSLSGVAVVAIMTRPDVCPHGRCVYCPGGLGSPFGDTPQSYTGFEPATRRAIRNNYDSFFQVMNRLEQYVLGGHDPNKVDLIVMGGTFPSYDINYQFEFILGVYMAMNKFSELFYTIVDGKPVLNHVAFKEWFELPHDVNDRDTEKRLKDKFKKLKEEALAELPQKATQDDKLEYVKLKNETTAIRCIGLTQETKPDCSLLEHCNRMLTHGTTRVELGIQTVYNDILRKTARGHTIKHSILATQILKDLGFKVNYHMMLGLPGVDEDKDLESLREIFKNDDFRPDMIKMYPTLVLPGTPLYERWEKGLYKPIELTAAAKIIGQFMAEIPSYVKVMRIQRDIPSTLVEGGVQKTNLRQYVEDYMKEHNLVCTE
ncbi:MAG: tRNA uridine(34) 5-carboxymethylaminomethyl modification radical SAM/GNAT enzyme Elp3, partial [Candidatus Woesearchaeota archaeon]